MSYFSPQITPTLLAEMEEEGAEMLHSGILRLRFTFPLPVDDTSPNFKHSVF